MKTSKDPVAKRKQKHMLKIFNAIPKKTAEIDSTAATAPTQTTRPYILQCRHFICWDNVSVLIPMGGCHPLSPRNVPRRAYLMVQMETKFLFLARNLGRLVVTAQQPRTNSEQMEAHVDTATWAETERSNNRIRQICADAFIKTTNNAFTERGEQLKEKPKEILVYAKYMSTIPLRRSTFTNVGENSVPGLDKFLLDNAKVYNSRPVSRFINCWAHEVCHGKDVAWHNAATTEQVLLTTTGTRSKIDRIAKDSEVK